MYLLHTRFTTRYWRYISDHDRLAFQLSRTSFSGGEGTGYKGKSEHMGQVVWLSSMKGECKLLAVCGTFTDDAEVKQMKWGWVHAYFKPRLQ